MKVLQIFLFVYNKMSRYQNHKPKKITPKYEYLRESTCLNLYKLQTKSSHYVNL